MSPNNADFFAHPRLPAETHPFAQQPHIATRTRNGIYHARAAQHINELLAQTNTGWRLEPAARNQTCRQNAPILVQKQAENAPENEGKGKISTTIDISAWKTSKNCQKTMQKTPKKYPPKPSSSAPGPPEISITPWKIREIPKRLRKNKVKIGVN